MYVLAFVGAAFWALLVSFVLGFAVFFFAVYATREDEIVEQTNYDGNVRMVKTGNKKVSGRGALVSLIIGFIAFLFFFGVMAAVSAYSPIQRGTIGLVSEFGGLTGQVFEQGLNWKTPFIQQVEIIDITQQSYEMSAHPESSNAQWTDFTVDSKTNDGQSITVSATTIFRVPPDSAVDIRQYIGDIHEVVENVVKAATRSYTRNEAKNWGAEQLYTGDVFGYQDATRNLVAAKFADTGHGLILVDFLIRGISFDLEYETAVEAKQIAAENIITQRNNAKAATEEAKREVELAKGKAQSEIEKAKGDAEARKLNADAEAYAIKERGEALKRYPQVLQLEFVNSLDEGWGYLPSTSVEWLLPAPDGSAK